jgi:molybdopterin-binding protein
VSPGSLLVRGLGARLGGFTLGPIDLELPVGAHLCIVGPSGHGKSALLWALAGVGTVDGAIALGGTSWTGLRPEARSVGLAPQDALLFPNRDVAGNIGYALRESSRTRGLELARTFGAEALLDRRTSQLSGGEAMRVALARALGRDPALLLLDEPLSAIDEAGRPPLQTALRMLRGTRTIVQVTHDLDEAASLATHLGVLLHGRLAAFGTVDDVLQRPPSPEVASFLGVENLLAGRFTPASEDASFFTCAGQTLHVLAHASGSGYVTIPERAVIVALESTGGISARNAIRGTIRAITTDREGARVTLSGAVTLTARLERESVTALGLSVGMEAFAVVKAAQVRVLASGG